MARSSPLLSHHTALGAALLPYGPAESGVQLVEAFAPFGLEYAAIRTGAALFDAPSRGLLRVIGPDRAAFLQRMVTQDMRGLEPWHFRRAFWLNRKGRIDADVLALELPTFRHAFMQEGVVLGGIADAGSTLLELDVHSAAATAKSLGAFTIGDDVVIDDLTEQVHQFQLHGPQTLTLLAQSATHVAGPTLEALASGQACAIEITAAANGTRCPALVVRHDLTGDPGCSIICDAANARAIYEALSHLPPVPINEGGALVAGSPPHRRLARRIGWHAINVARLEAGTTLYNLDYGPTSLPHETGPETLASRVSFTKGCYLGQEVVARMQSLGHPKQRLVALDFTADGGASPQPVTGSLVFVSADLAQPPVGAVTSSAVSPMLGGRTICLAMVKFASSAAGTPLSVLTAPGSAPVAATVRESLAFWRRGSIAAAAGGIASA